MHDTSKIIKNGSIIYEYQDGGVIHGYVKCQAADPPAGDPWIEWKGSKIPHLLWQQMLAFLIWTYDLAKPSADEAMVQLFYNAETGSWLAWAPPQRGCGMRVTTLDDHPNWKQSEAFVGYQLLGTGHHHCSAGAFQSGTDHTDEKQANGLHFTIGNLDKDFVSLHARVVFNGNMKETKLAEWVELSDRYVAAAEQLPELIPLMAAYSLESRPDASVTFPPEWKDNYIRTISSFIVGGNNGKYSTHSYYPKSGSYFKQPSQTKTPAELGEEALENMERTGMTFNDIMQVSTVLNKVGRENWNMDNENMHVITDMLHEYGLNARWLEKWVEVEQQIRLASAYGCES